MTDHQVGVCSKSHILPVAITYDDLSTEVLRLILAGRKNSVHHPRCVGGVHPIEEAVGGRVCPLGKQGAT